MNRYVDFAKEKGIFLARLLLIGSLLSSGIAQAETLLDVVKVEGEVFRTNEATKDQKALSPNEKISEGDQIEVGNQSRVLFGDKDSQFWLGSNSSVVVRAGKLVENTTTKRKVLSLLKGNLRVQIKSGEGQKFEVRTKAAVAGVRGTEFFFANENENVTFCVLSGKAWLKDEKSGQQFEVPEGAGVVLFADGSNKKTFTSEQTKYDWVAMTAFDGERRLTGSFYAPEPQPEIINDQFQYKYNFVAMARNYLNRDYDYQKADPSDYMYHAYFAPTLMYKSAVNVQLTPRLFFNKSDRPLQWDDVPVKNEDYRADGYLQDAFAETSQDNWSLRAGLFPLEWNENALFMSRPWMWESISHLGLQFSYLMGLDDTNIKIEAVYTNGDNVRDMTPINGRTNIGIKALRITEAKDRYVLNILERDSGDFVNTKSLYPRTGHKTQQIILGAKDTLESFDYNFSAGYQNTDLTSAKHILKKDSASGLSVDAALGLPFGNEYRTQVRFIHADPNYLPGIEDYYEMGYIGRFFHTNIRQGRWLLEKSLGDVHRIRFEYINTQSVGDSIFQTYQTTGKPPVGSSLLANEADLVWLATWNKSLQTYTALWYFPIGNYLTKNDPAWGANFGFKLTH